MAFRHIIGHRRLLEHIAGAAQRGSLAPSLIFVGPDGVGKRLTAVSLAQFLNCAHPVPLTQDAAIMDGCGACPSCSRIARGVHPDVVFLEPGETGAIKIDAVRDAIQRLAYRPFEGKRRVVIADDAEAMVPEAQNAMLKTLEEPPLGSTFVLVSSRHDVLLPTVRSRCQQLRFGTLAASEIASLLEANHEVLGGRGARRRRCRRRQHWPGARGRFGGVRDRARRRGHAADRRRLPGGSAQPPRQRASADRRQWRSR